MRVGYIGLGAMGSALARRLLDGHHLTVWDINPPAVAAFAQLGATAAPAATDIARGSDVIVLCLPRSADVRQAIFGAGGLASALSRGQLVIDQSSGTPQETHATAAELAELGVAMLDAPVSGNPTVVAAGRGTIMVSGTDEVYERALPLLHCFSRNVLRCGTRLGDAQAMKLINNTINAGCRLATLEAAALGRKLGLSLSCIAEVLNRGPGRNRTSEVMLPALIEGTSSTNFALALMLKDLNQSTTLGQQLNAPMPLAGLVRGLLQVGVNTLGERAQLEEVVQLVESMAGTRIASPGGVDSDPAAALIESTVAACNIALTWEAVAMGRCHGLALDVMVGVLNTSSGCSAALQRPLSTFSADDTRVEAQLQPFVADLRTAARLAAETGAPILIANAVRGLAETGGHAS
jgi:3-hydroxyisobutyrate dehydrogenase